MTTKATALRRMAAGVGAIALALVGVGAFSTAASAAQPDDGVAPGNAPANSTGTLHVHKRAGSQGATGNGSAITPVPGTALDGVTFSVKRVGILDTALACTTINLATPAGWAAAANAVGSNPSAPGSGSTAGSLCVDTSFTAQSEVTGIANPGSGDAIFDQLPLGLYYVEEGNAPSNVVEKALPFYVTVPFPSGTGANSNWLYNVHVYPKNALVNKGTKKINQTQTDLVLNADVTWTIEQVIPTLASTTSNFTEASVKDVLDSRLTYQSATVEIVNPTGTNIVAADYDFTNNPVGTLEWAFTNPEGLAKLKANQGKTLRVTLTTTVNSVGTGATAGQIDNVGIVSFNDKPTDTTIPYTYWGQIQLTKRGASETGVLLAGAKFEVFDNASGTPAGCPTLKPATGALATGLSGSDGVVDWTRADAPTPTVEQLGLWIKNSDTAVDPAPTKVYCVYETEAPAGYSIGAPNPRAVTVSTGENVLNSIQVVNPPVQGPNLPLTGSTGTAAMSIGGLALVALGSAVIVLARRNRREHADQ